MSFYIGIDPHEDGFTAVYWEVGKRAEMVRYQSEGLEGQAKWDANLFSLACAFSIDLCTKYPKPKSQITICIETPQTTGQIAGDQLFRTAHVAGYLRGAFEAHHYKVEPIQRRHVKAILLSSTSGTDAQIAEVVKGYVGLPGTKKNPGPTYGVSGDGWQALAAALAVKIRLDAKAERVAS